MRVALLKVGAAYWGARAQADVHAKLTGPAAAVPRACGRRTAPPQPTTSRGRGAAAARTLLHALPAFSTANAQSLFSTRCRRVRWCVVRQPLRRGRGRQSAQSHLPHSRVRACTGQRTQSHHRHHHCHCHRHCYPPLFAFSHAHAVHGAACQRLRCACEPQSRQFHDPHSLSPRCCRCAWQATAARHNAESMQGASRAV